MRTPVILIPRRSLAAGLVFTFADCPIPLLGRVITLLGGLVPAASAAVRAS
ncbi:hypothetical protein [Thermocatellispora tengchongensis]|uniref:hypothetical protein n=1 Tax=Thermocatellispora tengchongensis TaxID=1073253 RepID=UPI0033827CD0